ncbi:hypothetical protein COE51_01440 [Bacillus pseudomycoides]|nr:hypothetical protein COE51_01440 [Bacillus pseudomycoides]
MIVKNEVELHENSVEYLREVFTIYTEVDSLSRAVKNPIIHIYPEEDTYDEQGNLNGYIDSLFMTVCIYDTDKMTVYKSKNLHDGIMPFGMLNVSKIRIFKDLSTMIVLRGTYRINTSFAAIDIEEI